MGRRERGYEAKIAAIEEPVAKRRAGEIATCGVQVVVSLASVLPNCFIIGKRKGLHKDSESAIFLEPTVPTFCIDIRVPKYSVIQIPRIRFEFRFRMFVHL